MHSVQSSKKQLKLRSRQRRHRTSHDGVRAAKAVEVTPATATTRNPLYSKSSRRTTFFGVKSVPKIPTIVHGIVVSNLSLVLLQKEYIEQFYFEKRSGGGGPEDPDILGKCHMLAKSRHLYHGWLIIKDKDCWLPKTLAAWQYLSPVNLSLQHNLQQQPQHHQLKRRRLKTRSRNR